MSTSKSKGSLDLHGFRTADVLEAVDKFIVAAADSSLKQVRIVTGKGTGAVQKSVIAYLKQAHYTWKYEKLSNGKNNEGVLVIQME
ncbi:MAG: Smr/MutS family protein [Methylotenera sp.]|nr:Smr/MutS family protein [Oligoflexia bacterium]